MSEKATQSNEAPREFELVKDKTEASRLLKEGARTAASVIIWTKEKEQVVHTNLSFFSDDKKLIYTWFPKEGFNPADFRRSVAASPDRECFFSVSLNRAIVFFKSTFHEITSDSLQFELPEKVFKVQRRASLRFPIPSGQILKLEYDDPEHPERRLSKKVLDISASGLSFIIPDEEAGLYKKEQELKNFVFILRTRVIHTDAEIKHVQILPSGGRQKGIRIGVHFEGIRPADSQLIAAYVFEESRKYYSKFI